MSIVNLFLILGSACIHVIAHIAIKKTKNREAFIWWLLFWCWILFSPVLFFDWEKVTPTAWIFIVSSAVFEAMYFYSLGRAYQTSDLSIVYPLARGTAPVFLLLWTTIFIGEKPSFGGICGIFIIAFGMYIVNLSKIGDWKEPIQSLKEPGPRWAILSGLCISLYTAIDSRGISFAPPFIFTYLAMSITWVFLTPSALYSIGWLGLKNELIETRSSSIIAGFTTMIAYVIILFVMQNGELTSYVGAVREISVVLGTAIGIFILKEKGSRMRIIGAMLVALGVILIKSIG